MERKEEITVLSMDLTETTTSSFYEKMNPNSKEWFKIHGEEVMAMMVEEDNEDGRGEPSLSEQASSILRDYRILLLEWLKWMASFTPHINNPSGLMPSFMDSPIFENFLKRFRHQQIVWSRMIHKLKEHQQRHTDILELYRLLRQSRERQKCLATCLLDCRDRLEGQILSFERYHGPSVTAQAMNPIDLSDLLSYARKIAYTSSAPPGWNPSMPLRVTRPPAPQEDAMRTGHLYRHGLSSHLRSTTTTTHLPQSEDIHLHTSSLDDDEDVSL
jgi:hypothetical protein